MTSAGFEQKRSKETKKRNSGRHLFPFVFSVPPWFIPSSPRENAPIGQAGRNSSQGRRRRAYSCFGRDTVCQRGERVLIPWAKSLTQTA